MELSIIKYLTVRRVWNLLLAGISYLIATATKKPFVLGKPVFLFIEPTNRCNFQCPECPSGLGALTRPLGDMTPELFKKIIDDIKTYALYVQIYLQGEPYLNKDLHEMISYARAAGLYVVVSTNGSVVTHKTVSKLLQNPPDQLIFSMDGITEETYREYRVGGTFKAADEGLRLLMSKRKELNKSLPKVKLQFIVMKQNEHQIGQVKVYGKTLGVDQVAFKSMQVNSVEGAKHFLPDNPKYRRYKVGTGTLEVDGELRNSCINLWHTAVVTWDGNIVPCCFDKDANFKLGTLNGKGIAEHWNSGDYNAFRQKVLDNRKGINMCTNCTEGLKSKYFKV